MLILPVKFDSNEWFVIISLIVGYGLLYFLPLRFPRTIVILILMFSLIIAKMTDFMLGAPPLDLYDFNDTSEFDLMDFFTWFMYPPFGYLLVYYYDKLNIRDVSISIYIIICAAFSVGFEWFTLKAHVFTYKGWNLMYSFPTYLIVISITLIFYHFVKNYFYQSQDHRHGIR